MSEEYYKKKYLKYKEKYLIKKQIGGSNIFNEPFLYIQTPGTLFLQKKVIPIDMMTITRNEKEQTIESIHKEDNFNYIKIVNKNDNYQYYLSFIYNNATIFNAGIKLQVLIEIIKNNNECKIKIQNNLFKNLFNDTNVLVLEGLYNSSESILDIKKISFNKITKFKIDFPFIFQLDNPVKSLNELVSIYAETNVDYNIENHIEKYNKLKYCENDKYFIELIINYYYNKVLFNLSYNEYQEYIKHNSLMIYYINTLISRELTEDKTKEICENKDKYYENMFKKITVNYPLNNILFKNKDDLFITLIPIYNIIFDTGNANYTLIGKNIVEYLGLTINITCKPIILSGVIPSATQECKESVELEFKFNNFKNNYKITCYVDTGNPNQLLLGWKEGIQKLVDDKFTFYKQY